MQLHTFVGSPNGHKVEAVIDHLGLDVEIIHHDLLAGELRAPAYVALNPNAKVPTLVDGAFALWESDAIVQYLADKAGSDALFPRDPQMRADVVRWQFWSQAHFNKSFTWIVLETVIKPRFNRGPTNAAIVDLARTDLERFAPVLDDHLESHRYLVGDRITIADYSMIVLEGYRAAASFDWSPYPHINGYFDRMRAVDPWVRTAVTDPSTIGRKPKAA
jgi:glutathione S-transferase